MVVAAEVQHAVDDRFAQVAALLGADHHVPQLTRPSRRFGAVDREGQDVGGLVETAMLAIQLPDPVRVGNLDSEMALLHIRDLESRGDRIAQLRRHIGEIEGQLGSSTRVLSSRFRRGQVVPTPLRVLAVGRDYPLHELVPHDVLATEVNE
jgi:hypothetical protein